MPQATGLAISLGHIVGGALITEVIFAYPGIGYRILQRHQQPGLSVDPGRRATDHHLGGGGEFSNRHSLPDHRSTHSV
ncbi:MAG: hypothetical protein R2856_16745 [Caldilineaceae bacterium]